MTDEGLDLLGLLRAVLKRWYLVLFLPILTAALFYLYSHYNYVPVYSASTTLMVTRPISIDGGGMTSYDVYLSRALVSTYREIALSRRILKVMAEDEMITYDVDELRGKIMVEGIEDTELIKISVTDLDSVVASYIANMVSRIFMDEIGKVISGASVSILDEAPVSTNPSNPLSVRTLIIVYALGLLITVGIALLIDFLDQTLRDADEAEKLLGLPVVGLLFQIDGKNLGKRLSLTVNERSPEAEAFRTLRTNIQFTSADRPIKKILVTGANPGSGKSTVAANLAITFAQGGKAVLLVDADLRRPSQQNFFNVKSEIGLSRLVYNKEFELKQVVQKSGRDNLSLILSGPIPPYPAEMISSQRMKDLIAVMEENYDYVIFDSPPVLAVTDAVLLSSLVDGTLIVLDFGRVKREEAINTLKQLQMVQAKIIGTVINAVPKDKAPYSAYKSYYSVSDRQEKGRKKQAVIVVEEKGEVG